MCLIITHAQELNIGLAHNFDEWLGVRARASHARDLSTMKDRCWHNKISISGALDPFQIPPLAGFVRLDLWRVYTERISVEKAVSTPC